MRLIKCFLLCLMANLALVSLARPVADEEKEWYLEEVVHDVFVVQNDFEYYYQPTAADVTKQRAKGEVTYFLNTPTGLNSKKVRAIIDRLMGSYDDISAVGDWHMTTGTYWKEFRHERNKFRFSVKRKALEDGTYYVSVTESSNYYKSLSKGKGTAPKGTAKSEAPKKNSTRKGRRPVVEDDDSGVATEDLAAALVADEEEQAPVVSEKQRRQQAREKKQAEAEAERAKMRREKEQRREEARAQKEAERLKKAEEKKAKAEEKRLKKEEENQRREQARKEREQERREQRAARAQASAPKPVESKYHYTDVALWLSEKYDFTQTSAGEASCTMYSTAVKDVEMAKLAIKNALKGSNARMAVPWRVNSDTQAVETGYTVDGHVLVFAVGNDDEGRVVVTVTEVSGEQFERFKQGLD